MVVGWHVGCLTFTSFETQRWLHHNCRAVARSTTYSSGLIRIWVGSERKFTTWTAEKRISASERLRQTVRSCILSILLWKSRSVEKPALKD